MVETQIDMLETARVFVFVPHKHVTPEMRNASFAWPPQELPKGVVFFFGIERRPWVSFALESWGKRDAFTPEERRIFLEATILTAEGENEGFATALKEEIERGAVIRVDVRPSQIIDPD